MSVCSDCNYYCDDKRICILNGKFYFESFSSCDKYEGKISIEDWDMMGYISDMESFE